MVQLQQVKLLNKYTVYYLIVICFLFTLPINAQLKIDSLLNSLAQQKPDKPNLAISDTLISKTYNRIVYTYEDQKNMEMAIKYNILQIKFLEKLIEQNSSNRSINLVKKDYAVVLVGLSRAFRMTGQNEKAIEMVLRTFPIRKEIGDSLGYLRSHNNLGMLYSDQGSYLKSLEVFFEGLKLCDQMKNKVMKATILNNIGNCYGNIDDYAKSLIYFEKAYAAAKEADLKWLQVLCLNNIGEIKFDKGKGDAQKSRSMFLQSQKLASEIGDSSGLGNAMINEATVLKVAKKLDSAILILRQAETILFLYKDLRTYHLCRVALAAIYIEKAVMNDKASAKLISSAFEMLLDAEKYYLKSRNKTNLKDTYFHLSELYALKGDYKTSGDVFKKYILYKDSIQSEEMQKKTLKAELNYEFEMKESKMKLEQKQKEALIIEEQAKQRIIRNSLIFGFVLVALIALLIFIGYRNKRNANLQITKQKLEVEKQKYFVEIQKEQLDKSQKQILDSINYAKHIQSSILPKEEKIKDLFVDSFVFYKPKDIVSGDFFWFKKIDSKTIVIVGDCTGHGVPGALLSMIGTTIINDIVLQRKFYSPHKIIQELSETITITLSLSGQNDEISDGMDISICVYDSDTGQLEYFGVNQPLYQANNNSIKIIEPQIRTFTGIFSSGEITGSQSIVLTPLKGDMFYMLTDGFKDQVGGTAKKKYGEERFERLLSSISHNDSVKQLGQISDNFNDWKGSLKQVDDICLIGFKPVG